MKARTTDRTETTMAAAPMPENYPQCGAPCTHCGKPVEAGRLFYFDGKGPESPVIHFSCAHERHEAETTAKPTETP